MSQILVIDDEVVSRQFLIAVLQRLGLGKVSEAVDGLDALMQLDAGDRVFDLIFCDLDMPRMDGIEFVRHLGERRYRGKLLITSGFDGRVLSSVATWRACTPCACAACCPPVDPVQLLALLAAPVEPGEAISLPLERLSSKELQQGIARGEVVPFFQPQVEVASGKVLGVEVLARWQHPQLLAQSAAVHRTGGGERPDHAADQAPAGGFRASADTAGHAAAAEYVDQSVDAVAEGLQPGGRLRRHLGRCRPGCAAGDLRGDRERRDGGPARALEILTRLRLKGAGLAIDDFGTGFASMHRLSRIPFTEMKIDKSFVIDAAAHATKRSIFEASVELGRRLGLNVVAEGVASEQEWALCRTFGVFAAQGSFISPPVDEASFSAWLAGCGGQMPLPS